MVYATCYDAKGRGGKELEKLGINVQQLDVTKEDQWDKVIAHISEKSHVLWGLVNNAGWSTFGNIEWVPTETYQKIVDINIFGLLKAVQKTAPLIRPAQGRIVTVTSGLVRGPASGRSAYVLTKYAGVGMMEVLRYEMKRFGVQVSLILDTKYSQYVAKMLSKCSRNVAEM